MTTNRTRIVKKQPRDEKGRWTVRRHTVLIDESGDLGKKPGASKKFTMSATITTHPQDLVAIVDKHPKNTRNKKYPGELKFSNSSDQVRNDVLDELMGTDPLIRSVIRNKHDITNGGDTYRDTTREIISDVLDTTPGKVDIIMDNHDAIKNGRGERLCKKIADGKGRTDVECTVVPSKDSPMLQAHDFVAGAVGSKHNNDNPSFFRKIARRTTEREINGEK